MRRALTVLVPAAALTAAFLLRPYLSADADQARQKAQQQRVARAASTSSIQGVEWYSNFDAARAEARRVGKPVLLLQLFGRLDEKWC